MKRKCSAAFSLTIRLRLQNTPGSFSRVASAIGDVGGDLGDIAIFSETRDEIVRDINIRLRDTDHQKEAVASIRALSDVEIMCVVEDTFACHEGGKIETGCVVTVDDAAALSQVYTPGVARICRAIDKNPALANRLTIRANTVAIVSDGTAILGLGDLGAKAAMPVMEGKAMLFKRFGDVDGFPICLDTKDPEEIINIVKAIAPTFGGINLEDISAPRCFEIEDRLKEELDIPVFHDDQHGTAIVTLAALLNALKIVKKDITTLKVIFAGVGAAGMACSKLLIEAGVKNIIGCDRSGAIYNGRSENMNVAKQWYAENTNPENEKGTLAEVLKGADLFVGVSGPDILSVEDVKSMNESPIIFAMSNPDPEIAPELAAPHVAVMATGRSDYPNQINNVLAFPGVFRGALDCSASKITENMKVAAAEAIAGCVSEEELSADYIIPSPFDPAVPDAVAEAVMIAADKDGVCNATEHLIEGVDDLL